MVVLIWEVAEVALIAVAVGCVSYSAWKDVDCKDS